MSPDVILPSAAKEAGPCGKGREASAGPDATAGSLRKARANGASAAHEVGKRVGKSEDAAGERDGALGLWIF